MNAYELLDLALCTVLVLAAAGVLYFGAVWVSRGLFAFGRRVDRYLTRHVDRALATDPHVRRHDRGDDWFGGAA